MLKELLTFLNFKLSYEMVHIKSIGETVSEVPRYSLNWKEYQNKLAEGGIKSDIQSRPLFSRYTALKPDSIFFDELIAFQQELRQLLMGILAERKIAQSVWQRIFKDSDGLAVFIEPVGPAGDWSQEDVANLKFNYNFDAETYRAFITGLVRELIINKEIFHLALDETGSFYFCAPKELSPVMLEVSAPPVVERAVIPESFTLVASVPIEEEVITLADAAPIEEEVITLVDNALVEEEVITLADAAPIEEEVIALADAAPIEEEVIALADDALLEEEIIALADTAPIEEEVIALADDALVEEEVITLVDDALVEKEVITLADAAPVAEENPILTAPELSQKVISTALEDEEYGQSYLLNKGTPESFQPPYFNAPEDDEEPILLTQLVENEDFLRSVTDIEEDGALGEPDETEPLELGNVADDFSSETETQDIASLVVPEEELPPSQVLAQAPSIPSDFVAEVNPAPVPVEEALTAKMTVEDAVAETIGQEVQEEDPAPLLFAMVAPLNAAEVSKKKRAKPSVELLVATIDQRKKKKTKPADPNQETFDF